jgi:hypothetical protein
MWALMAKAALAQRGAGRLLRQQAGHGAVLLRPPAATDSLAGASVKAGSESLFLLDAEQF